MPIFEQYGVDWHAVGVPVDKKYGGKDGEVYDFRAGDCEIPLPRDQVRDEVQQVLTEQAGWRYREIAGVYEFTKKHDGETLFVLLLTGKDDDEDSTIVDIFDSTGM